MIRSCSLFLQGLSTSWIDSCLIKWKFKPRGVVAMAGISMRKPHVNYVLFCFKLSILVDFCRPKANQPIRAVDTTSHPPLPPKYFPFQCKSQVLDISSCIWPGQLTPWPVTGGGPVNREIKHYSLYHDNQTHYLPVSPVIVSPHLLKVVVSSKSHANCVQLDRPSPWGMNVCHRLHSTYLILFCMNYCYCARLVIK